MAGGFINFSGYTKEVSHGHRAVVVVTKEKGIITPVDEGGPDYLHDEALVKLEPE